MKNITVAVAALAGLFIDPAFAAPPPTVNVSDTIRACVNNNSGDVKIVRAGVACDKHSSPLTWNQAGTPGPAGPQGPQGPQGPLGIQGPSGLANTQVFWSRYMYPGTSVNRAMCPPDTQVTGGGGFSLNGAGLKYSFPIQEGGDIAYGTNARGWQVAATDWSDVHAFVVCASP